MVKKLNNIIHPHLVLAQELVYEANDLICSSILEQEESKEYGAYTFKLNSKNIIFRVAKITSTKIGQFVTIWKRIKNGPILPYDISDPVDLFVISVRNNEYFGQFIFTKEILLEQGVLSKNSIGGKRAIRLYPPWDVPNSKQAKNTQEWQLKYFVQIKPKVDNPKINKLFF